MQEVHFVRRANILQFVSCKYLLVPVSSESCKRGIRLDNELFL